MDKLTQKLVDDGIITITEGKQEDFETHLTGLSTIKPEGVEAYLETDEGRQILQPRLDQYFTKGLETWKGKTLPGVIEEEITKRFPGETEEQKRLRSLEADLASEKSARLKEISRNAALAKAMKAGVSSDLVDLAVREDKDETLKEIDKIIGIFNSDVQAEVDKRFKIGGREIDPGTPDPVDIKDEIRAAEAAKDWKKTISLKTKLMK